MPAARAAAVLSIAVVLLCGGAYALDNGVALTPPLGWSSWNTFGYGVSDSLIRSMADAMVSSGLAAAGYEYVLIDDGWTACATFKSNGGCEVQAPRDEQGRIPVDPIKFPAGMRAVSDYVHSRGLKIGIYTAVSNATCGGFSSSLGYESIDAQTFGVEWEMDFVKSDTCNYDCSIRDGCIQASTARMRDGLNATGRPIVYYIDDGNDSSGSRLYNPFEHHTDSELLIKIAAEPRELVWYWGPETANMWKLWFDHHDHWYSTMDNIQHMIGLEMYQKCGGYNTPDMVTIGQGALTDGQYRVQMFIWSVLGAPILLGCDLRSASNATIALVTSPEVLAIDQDSECVAGSFVRAQPGGGQLWIRPLSDGTFAAVLFNANPTQALNMSIVLGEAENYGDLYPATVGFVSIRDVYKRMELGIWAEYFWHSVPPNDAVILKLTPL